MNSMSTALRVLDHLPDLCVLVGHDWTCLYANEAVLACSGHTRADVIGRDVRLGLPRLRQATTLDKIAQVMEHRISLCMEMQYPFEGLDYEWIDLHIEPVKEGVFLFMRDISNSKKNELRHLLDSQIIANARWGIAIADIDTNTLVMVNPAFAEMYGYRVDELVGQPIALLRPAEGSAHLHEEIEENHQAGYRRYEANTLHKKGHIFPVSIDVTTMRDDDGKVRYHIANVQDISEMVAVRDEVRLSQEFFKSAFDNAPAALAVCDLAGRYTRVNQAMCSFLGYSELELIGMSYRDVTYPDDMDKNDAERLRMLAGEFESFQMEKRYVRKNGQVAWALMVVSLIRRGDGKPLYSIGQMLDIDRQKTAEQEVLRSREQLRALAAYHEAMLEEERKRIARDIHDELGQQLTALKMDIGLLRLRNGNDQGVLALAKEMRDRVDNTIGLVRRVASDLRPAALDLGIAAAIEWLAEDFSGRTGIKCVVENAGDDAEYQLQEAHGVVVFRVVQESLTNIVRHAKASRVDIRLQREGRYFSLRIEDNGEGFDPAAIGSKRGYGLLGMRERVRSLDGLLTIDSAYAKGTKILISLPVHTP